MTIPIKIGKHGRIKNGEHAGYLVRIDDDMANTGGYLILCWLEDNPSVGFDGWVEKRDDLEQFFRETGWNVEWLE